MRYEVRKFEGHYAEVFDTLRDLTVAAFASDNMATEYAATCNKEHNVRIDKLRDALLNAAAQLTACIESHHAGLPKVGE